MQYGLLKTVVFVKGYCVTQQFYYRQWTHEKTKTKTVSIHISILSNFPTLALRALPFKGFGYMCPGWENFRWSEAKSFSSGSHTNTSDEKEGYHLVLHLVKSVCVGFFYISIKSNSMFLLLIPFSFRSLNIPVPPLHIRFVNVLVYYGLSLGVSRLGTNLYLTQFVFGLVEIPARSLVLLVLPFSRRLSQCGFLAAGGLACLLMLAVPAGTMDPVCLLCSDKKVNFL